MTKALPARAWAPSFLLPASGAAVVWLTYPVLAFVRSGWFPQVMLGLASAAVAAGAWGGARAAARAGERWATVAAGLATAGLGFLGLMAFFAPNGPGGGRPGTIVAGSFFFLPLSLGYAASAVGVAAPRWEGARRWGVLAAGTAAGLLAFLLADRGTDFGDIFHGTHDYRILVLLPGLLPLGVGLAALAVPPEDAPRASAWLAGGSLTAAGFLVPWLFTLPWWVVGGSDGGVLRVLASAPALLPLALLAGATFLLRGTRRGVLATAVMVTAMPAWVALCMQVCDFPT